MIGCRNLNDFKAISYDYQKANRVHSSALQSLLMNAADLSDQLKDWGSVKKTAVSAYNYISNFTVG